LAAKVRASAPLSKLIVNDIEDKRSLIELYWSVV
jgi:hypothetical protein